MKSINLAAFLAALFVLASCQNATQPTNVTTSRTITLDVHSSTQQPITPATVEWLKFTGVNAPIGSTVTTGPDGLARILVPDVSTRRDSVRMTVSMPPSSPYAGIGPLTISTAVCTDTSIVLALSPQTPCGTLSVTDTMHLYACPQSTPSFSRDCRVYPTTCQGGVVFTTTDSSQGGITIAVTSDGQTSSAATVCATYAPASASGTGQTETMQVNVEGRLPGSATVLVRIALTVIGHTNCDACPCPTVQGVATTTDTVCVGSTSNVQVPLSTLVSPISSSPDCTTEFVLRSSSNTDVAVSSGDQFSVRNGQPFPTITLGVSPTTAAPMRTTLTYDVRTRKNSTGAVTDCPSTFQVDATIPVVTTTCAVSRTSLDTLQKCVFNDSSTVDTFSVANNGSCPLVIEVLSNSTLFTVSPSGMVSIPPHKSQKFTVTFTATKRDWDLSPLPPSGARGEKLFAAQIIVNGCGNTQKFLPVHGSAYVQCNAFKYQCLRQFRPPAFPNTYAESIQLVEDKTNIVYQNDNQRFQQYDIFIKDLTPNGASFDVELGSGTVANGSSSYGVFKRIATGFTVNPGESICDRYPVNATSECTSMKADVSQGTSTLGGLRPGDVVLYVKIGSSGSPQCALIWIQSVGLDRPGANALPQACIEICYPMFTL